MAACALVEDSTWSGELVVQAVADEEDGSLFGAEYLLGLGLLVADGAVVAEPTDCAPSLAQLGNAWAEVTVTGRAAHAGTPERGRDAFRATAVYVAELDELLSDVEPDPDFLGHPRLNVGDVVMPGHPGTVPGYCRLRCDVRVLPGRDRDQTFELYRLAARRVERRLGVRVAVACYRGGGCRSHRVSMSHPLAGAFRAAQLATGYAATTTAFAGGTDARYFAEAGTPAVVYGPGSLERAHAPDEYVPIRELRLAAEQLKAAALTFLHKEGDHS